MMPAAKLGLHGPYEDLAIALIDLFKTIIEGQPADVRAELWRMYLEDLRAWREYWARALPKLVEGPKE